MSRCSFEFELVFVKLNNNDTRRILERARSFCKIAISPAVQKVYLHAGLRKVTKDQEPVVPHRGDLSALPNLWVSSGTATSCWINCMCKIQLNQKAKGNLLLLFRE